MEGIFYFSFNVGGLLLINFSYVWVGLNFIYFSCSGLLKMLNANIGTMLVGFPCLLNILRRRFVKDLWLFLLIVNGFGTVTGSIL